MAGRELKLNGSKFLPRISVTTSSTMGSLSTARIISTANITPKRKSIDKVFWFVFWLFLLFNKKANAYRMRFWEILCTPFSTVSFTLLNSCMELFSIFQYISKNHPPLRVLQIRRKFYYFTVKELIIIILSAGQINLVLPGIAHKTNIWYISFWLRAIMPFKKFRWAHSHLFRLSAAETDFSGSHVDTRMSTWTRFNIVVQRRWTVTVVTFYEKSICKRTVLSNQLELLLLYKWSHTLNRILSRARGFREDLTNRLLRRFLFASVSHL